MEGDDARWACLAWLVVTTTHRLLVVQVKASKELPTGWHCVPDLLDREVVASTGSSPSATSTHSALRSVPTATVRTHLPGLFSSEPLKCYH